MPDNWTKDEAGEYIRWDQPPHYIRGVLTLVLPGEKHLDDDQLHKRIEEYLRLRWREMKRKKNDGPRV